MKYSRRIENLIASLRSFPKDESTSIVRQPFKIDSILEVIFERYKIGKRRPAETIIENWKSVMGEVNAHRCSPTRIDRNGRLIVQVANQTLRQELNFQRVAILNRIRHLPGCESVKDIRLTAG